MSWYSKALGWFYDHENETCTIGTLLIEPSPHSLSILLISRPGLTATLEAFTHQGEITTDSYKIQARIPSIVTQVCPHNKERLRKCIEILPQHRHVARH